MSAVEYSLHMSNGFMFQTGGFESIDSLMGLVIDGKPIEGVFGTRHEGGLAAWSPTLIAPAHVIAVVDRRPKD